MASLDLTPVPRGHIVADESFLFEGTSVATASEPDPTHDRRRCPVYNVVIDHPDATILWDTGSHPDAGDGHWPAELYDAFTHEDTRRLADDLDAVGYDIDDIDAVVMSHLHLDHAGGLYNFAGTDVPIYVHREEFEFAHVSAKTAHGDEAYLAGDFDHDLDWHLVSGPRSTPFPDVDLFHLPGHSPGLVATAIHREEGTVILAGDIGYVRENWTERRPMGGALLWNKEDWLASCARLDDLATRFDATVVVGHDPDAMEQLQR
ncbi:N-acyl homoserine lactonase family protein [Haloarchaeobius amylolyticus]|uniref:N-acyl homoserine lactonase family protein n=1 Tax=Haloarchaeobius amylolyticus TaxID=1198296 RepID=UPI0022708F39|nr:N-acyl homoserine lactonase family protein [Haloarchaeobius amylolyticus]